MAGLSRLTPQTFAYRFDLQGITGYGTETGGVWQGDPRPLKICYKKCTIRLLFSVLFKDFSLVIVLQIKRDSTKYF